MKKDFENESSLHVHTYALGLHTGCCTKPYAHRVMTLIIHMLEKPLLAQMT